MSFLIFGGASEEALMWSGAPWNWVAHLLKNGIRRLWADPTLETKSIFFSNYFISVVLETVVRVPKWVYRAVMRYNEFPWKLYTESILPFVDIGRLTMDPAQGTLTGREGATIVR